LNIVKNHSTFCCGFCLFDEVKICDMKHIKFILLFLVFIGSILYITKKGAKEYTDTNAVLKNGVVFEGTVTDIKRSHNHGFGVLSVNVSNSNVNEFSKELKHGIYPYRIKGKKAEIYLPIYIEREIGDRIKLISDREIIYYKGKKSEDKGEVYIITNPSDINFVKENSIFNKE